MWTIRPYSGNKGKKVTQYVPFLVLQVCFKMLSRNNIQCFYIIAKPSIESVFSVNWTFTELVYWETDTRASMYLYTAYISIYVHTQPSGAYMQTFYPHVHMSRTLPFRSHSLPVRDETLKAVGFKRLAPLQTTARPCCWLLFEELEEQLETGNALADFREGKT